jgi:3',5'-cyclic-AMP phosphodiesterase
MRFIHITDTHIGPTPEHRVLTQLALTTLEALVDRINALPFEPDFILHTGDIVDDGSGAAYALARPVLQKLKRPIYYVLGNHDLPVPMRTVLLGEPASADRYDYNVDLDGTQLVVIDTRGPIDPAGTLTADQLQNLRDLCTPDGPPLIIALHHQPVKLDVGWLDNGWDQKHMMIDNSAAFLEAIAPARQRIRGVFFGHVHRGCHVLHRGILFSSPPSACAEIQAWPTSNYPVPSPEEQPGFNIVTITDDETTIRQYTFPRPVQAPTAAATATRH